MKVGGSHGHGKGCYSGDYEASVVTSSFFPLTERKFDFKKENCRKSKKTLNFVSLGQMVHWIDGWLDDR